MIQYNDKQLNSFAMKLYHSLLLLLLFFITISCSSSDDTIITPQNNNEEEVITEEETEEMEETEEEENEEEEETSNKLVGTFVSAAHPTSGMAMINEDKTELMLTNFKSDDGPNLELYIATDVNATNYITLGSLKGLEGDFVYDLPENIDFVDYNYVMVWCVPFSVNFGHAIVE